MCTRIARRILVDVGPLPCTPWRGPRPHVAKTAPRSTPTPRPCTVPCACERWILDRRRPDRGPSSRQCHRLDLPRDGRGFRRHDVLPGVRRPDYRHRPPLVARGRLDRLSGRVAIALGERPHHLSVRHPGRCNGRIDLVERRIADFSVDLCCRRVAKFANWPVRRDRLSVDAESQNHRTPVPVSQETLATSPLGTQGRSLSARRIGLVRVHERWRF